MGKGKKPQNEDEVLGQIFDFIFKEARKDPSKRRPVKLKPTGISTSGALVDSLAMALEKPGFLITDQMLASMNDSLSIEFARMNADERGDNKARFTTTSLIDFFSDPEKFMSKPMQATKTGIRKYMNAGWLGQTQKELQAYAWAQKYNLDLDAKKAIRGHFMADKEGTEAEAGRAFAIAAGALAAGGDTVNSRKNYAASRSADLVGREMFGRSGWESMSDERKAGLQKALFRGKNASGNDAVEEYLTKTYTGSSAKYAGMALTRYNDLRVSLGLRHATDPSKKNNPVPLFDLGNYNKLEVRNLAGRMDDMELYLKRNPGLSINEQAKIREGIEQLGQAAVIVSGNSTDLATVNLAKKELNLKITNSQSELQLAQRAGDKNKIRYYKNQIKVLKQGGRELNRLKLWGEIGKWEGRKNSWQGIMGGIGSENAVLSILNGDFYDGEKNTIFLPTEDENIELGSYSWKIKNEEGVETTMPYKENIRIKVAAEVDLKGLTGLKRARAASINRYNYLMTKIYYITPKTVMRTFLVNGEGFVYLSYRTTQNALSALAKKGVKDGIDFERLMKDKAYRDSLKKLGVDANTLFATRGLAQMFSFGQRQRDKVKNWMDDHVFRKLRQRVYNSLINRLKDKEAKILLEQWLLKGGFQVLAKSIVTGLLTAIGIGVTGGLGSFIAPMLAAVVTDVLYASVKVLIQVALLVFLGIIGFIFFLSTPAAKKSFDSQTYAYTNVVPGDVVNNPNYQDIPDPYTYIDPLTGEPVTPLPGEPIDPLLPIYTGDIEAIFNQVRAEMGLSTTLTLVICTDGIDENEAACNMISWAWCYSGASVYCRIDKLAGVSDSVLSNLFRHELMHQIQSGGEELVREWGADFVSNNGGGYRFNTPDGIKRATETRGALQSRGCSDQQLNDIAFGRGLSGPCYDAWKSYILGFGAR